jgi:hypothetical protein
MKAILICPHSRPAVGQLAEFCPLAIVPILGKSLIAYWLDYLVTKGAHRVHILTSDRPDQIRRVVGTGARWGLQVELFPRINETTVEQVRAKFHTSDEGWLAPPDDVHLMDHLPGQPQFPLFTSYAAWFHALRAWIPSAQAPDRIGSHEIRPNVWVGLKSRIAETARLQAPCWIGENVFIGPDATVGPGAIIEDRAFVEGGAVVVQSIVGTDTFVGALTQVKNSLANGSLLVNWNNGSCLRVPDPFLLGPLDRREAAPKASTWPGRILAALVMLATAPVVLLSLIVAGIDRQPIFDFHLAVQPRRSVRSPWNETFFYGELSRARGWLRRWPQLWDVVCGRFAWVGNRPLRPAEAAMLSSDFAALWLTAPIGLVSLADVEGCGEGVSEEACAHSSYYAVCGDWKLDCSILMRALRGAPRPAPKTRKRRKAIPSRHPVHSGLIHQEKRTL